jgi:hypothetical protein
MLQRLKNDFFFYWYDMPQCPLLGGKADIDGDSNSDSHNARLWNVAEVMPKPIAPVTIAAIRAHGVRQLLVYCRGKRDGDWPCHHEGTSPVECFGDDEALADIERRCRCTACGWRRADLRPDYGAQQTVRQSAGWMMPPQIGN